MSQNNRVYYAVHAVGFSKFDAVPDFKVASGVQSVGVNTNFSLEQVFQLGQLEIYDNIESIPNVELTIEKVLDGTALLQHLATQNATAATLPGRYNNDRANVAVAFFKDTLESATGTNNFTHRLAVMLCSGMYVSSMSFNMPVDGNFTESVTLVGNDKVWATGTAITAEYGFNPNMPGTDLATVGGHASGVMRRQELLMSGCTWPTLIPGMVATTGGDARYPGAYNPGDPAYGSFAVHIQNVQVSVDLGRQELFELGRRGPYHRYADFPTEVTTTIEIIENEYGDFIDAISTADNTTNEAIYLYTVEGTRIDLGVKNRLQSVSSSGGDTGGGNRTTTYTFVNFNNFTVTHTDDPVVALQGAVTTN